MNEANWLDVGAESDLDLAGHLDVEVDARPVTVVRVTGRLYAFEDRCSHDGEPLAGGEIDPGDEPAVICPRHGARFCIRTGDALSAPAYEPTAKLPLRVENGVIEVKDDRWD